MYIERSCKSLAAAVIVGCFRAIAEGSANDESWLLTSERSQVFLDSLGYGNVNLTAVIQAVKAGRSLTIAGGHWKR